MKPAFLSFNDQPQTGWNSKKQILRIGSLLLAVTLVSVLSLTHPRETSARSSINNIKMVSVDGQEYTLAGLKGKVVVLDFFGIRCAHSRDHIKETMVKFGKDDFERGLQLIGVESESSKPEMVRNFIKEQGLIYPVVQVDEPTFVRFVNSRDLSAPQTLVFGRDGKLLLHTLGFSYKNEEAIRSTVMKALDAK